MFQPSALDDGGRYLVISGAKSIGSYESLPAAFAAAVSASEATPGVQFDVVEFYGRALVAAADVLPATVAPRLGISRNGRYFRLNGRRFYYVADTGWSATRNLSREEITAYLEDRAGRGVRVIQGPICTSRSINLPPFDDGPDDPWRCEEGVMVLNGAYWSIIDWMVQEAGRLGLVLMLAPTWGPDSTWFFPAVEDQVRYASLVAARYRNQAHIGYIATGEYQKIRYVLDAQGRIESTPDRDLTGAERARFVAVADAIRGAAHPGALVVYHADWARLVSIDFPQGSTGTDAHFLQAGPSLTAAIRDVQAERGSSAVRPVVQAETAYEGEPSGTPEQIRAAAWHAVLSGGAGFAYGNGRVWDFDPDWRELLAAPGALNTFGVYADLVQRIHHENNAPALGLIVDPGSVDAPDSYVSALRSADGALVWAYVGNGRSFSVRTSQIGQRVDARWIDPRAGTFGAWFAVPAGDSVVMNPPGAEGHGNDWLLELSSVQIAPPPATGLRVRFLVPEDNEDGTPLRFPLRYVVGYVPIDSSAAEIVSQAVIQGDVLEVAGVPPGQYLVRARAIDADEEVSEWSQSVRVDAAGAPVALNMLADDFGGAVGPVAGRRPSVAPAGVTWRHESMRVGSVVNNAVMAGDGRLEISATGALQGAVIDAGRGDYVLRVRLHTGALTGVRAFLPVRRTDAANQYYWNLRPANGDVNLYRIANDQQTAIVGAAFQWQAARWYDVTITVLGGLTTLAIDGAVIAQGAIEGAGTDCGLGAAGNSAPVVFSAFSIGAP